MNALMNVSPVGIDGACEIPAILSNSVVAP